MKKLTLLLLTCLSIYISQAATITVSNNPNSPGQYTVIQHAIDSASSGDVILIAGSATTYSSFVNNKKALHIKGVGSNPDKQIPLSTMVNSFNVGVYSATESGSGTIIEGIDFGASNGNDVLSGLSALIPLTNVTIRRCEGVRLVPSYYVNGVNIYNCNITMFLMPNNGNSHDIQNVTLANNILGGLRIVSDYPNTIQTVIIKNNLMKAGLYGCVNTTFTNNIFYNAYHNGAYSYCNFSNNLSFAGDTLFNTSGTNGGGNNIINQDPLFVNESNNVFDNTDDFNTPINSPAHNAGSDGTDIGIYGGTYPWPDGGASGSGFMYSQEPAIPQVNQMNITTTTVPVGGNLTVTAKGIVNH